MAHIRKRKLPSGKTRWQVIWDGADGNCGRERQSAMFDTQRDAKEKLAAVLNNRAKSSAPFNLLTDHFLGHYEKLVENGQRERATLRQLEQHIKLHILADTEFGELKCNSIGTPEVQLFLDRLIDHVSPKMSSKVRSTLSRIFAHGARRGFVATNPVASSKIERRTRPDAGAPVHFTLPSKEDLRALLSAAQRHDNTGCAVAVIKLLVFTGLRISELRGLRRDAATLADTALQVRIVQRADRFNQIGPVKGAASHRIIDLGPDTASALRVWAVAAPAGELLFCNDDGGVWSYPNFWHRFWVPLLNAAGLVTIEAASKTVRTWSKAQADFKQPAFGPHMLRHVYASLQIERGVAPKRLQKLMGHATLKLTLDTYGHLWPDNDADLLTRAELRTRCELLWRRRGVGTK